eukprot:m.9905 g.9905  ORF g.9905 m.9905 type:complete len:182 (-) comp7288_c0_seq1:100-645(-)
MVRVRKVALLGFPAVGKSSLAMQFSEGKFDNQYVATIDDLLTKKLTIANRDYDLHLYDTMGVTEQPNFPENYLTADGWIFVFSVASRRSFDLLPDIYDRLVQDVGGRPMPLVVVGNKTDLNSEREVSQDDGKRFSQKIQAQYLESSAKDNQNVQQVFEAIIHQIEKLSGDPIKEDKDCTIL